MLINMVILIFFLTLSILTWGYAIKFNFINNIRLDLSGDPAFYIWAFKWLPYAIKNDLNIFITDLFWYPYGQNLAWTTFIPSLSLTFWYITENFTPILSYNLSHILTLALGSFGFYLLCRVIGFSHVASFLASVLFFFSPYQWTKFLSHLNLSVVFPVVYVLLLGALRFKSRINRLVYILITALILAYQFGISNEIYATVITVGFISMLLALVIYKDDVYVRNNVKALMGETLIASILSALILSPYIYFMLKDRPEKHIGDIYRYVADPLNLIIPNKVNMLFGNIVAPINQKYSSPLEEATAYIGLPLIAILVWSFIKFYKKDKFFVYMLISLLVILIFSFGAYLTILGNKTIPLPWLFFTKLPFIKHALPVRLTLYSFLVACIIFAYWFDRISLNLWKKFAIFLSAVIFIVPNLGIYTNYNSVDRFYTEFFKSDYKNYISEGDIVMIFPGYGQWSIPAFYQANTDFYFKIPQQVAGPIPKELEGRFIPTEHWAPNIPENAPVKFLEFILRSDVDIILVNNDYINNVLKNHGYMVEVIRILKMLNFKSTNSEEFTLHFIDREEALTLLKKLRRMYSKKILNSLLEMDGAVIEYYKIFNDLYDIYPEKLIRLGVLGDVYRGFDREHPGFNWTKTGYWLGNWENSYAIGYSKADGYVLEAVLESKLRNKILKVFFPYPEEFDISKFDLNKHADIKGHLLLYMKHPADILD